MFGTVVGAALGWFVLNRYCNANSQQPLACHSLIDPASTNLQTTALCVGGGAVVGYLLTR